MNEQSISFFRFRYKQFESSNFSTFQIIITEAPEFNFLLKSSAFSGSKVFPQVHYILVPTSKFDTENWSINISQIVRSAFKISSSISNLTL